MKALLQVFTPIFFFALLAGCSKDDDVAPLTTPVATEQIKGKWINEVNSLQYFDASGKMVYEERDTLDYVELYDFQEAGKCILTYSDFPDDVYPFDYSISTKDNKQILTFKEGSLSRDLTIDKMDNKNMVWISDNSDTEYIENGTLKTANKAREINYLIKN